MIKPVSMNIACDGSVLVCDRGDNRVKVFSPDGTNLLQSVSDQDCVESPCLALRHQDMFYVSYGKAKCVKVFNNEGEFLYKIVTEEPGKLHRPTGLAVDKFNNLLVCDGKYVQVFTLEGKMVNSIKGQPIQIQNPLAVAVSNAGQVFITDIGNHCVHVFE